MLKALKANQLIEKYSFQLLKYSLSGDDSDFWSTYEEMLQTLGYVRVNLNDQIFVIKHHENRMYLQYQAFSKQKIQAVDLLQTIQKQQFWQKQCQHSDQFQYSYSLHCVLTPLSFSLSSEISKISNYTISSYAFFLKDYVVYSNKIAQNKGILKGLPILLAKKIDPDTKFIELNRFSHTKFEEIFDIFKQRYRDLNPFLKGQEIHFNLKYEKSNQNLMEILKVQIQSIVEDLYEISGLKMFAFVSRNQVICDIFIKDTPLQMIEKKNNQVLILIDDKEINQALLKCKISSIPGISLNQVRFLSPNIKSVKQLLQNLHVLEIITSFEQTKIFFLTCLGIDHRQNLQYIEMKRRQFQAVGLNYDKIVPPSEQVRIESLKRENLKKNKIKEELKQMDSDSVRSEKVYETKKMQPINTKSEKIMTSKASEKQLFFPMFGKKGKK